jgi:hypothetical protein
MMLVAATMLGDTLVVLLVSMLWQIVMMVVIDRP